MSNRSKNKYHQYSSYCPDDKDIYDYLRGRKPSVDKLHAYLRNRGIFFGSSSPSVKEDMIEYISYLLVDWDQYNRLVDFTDVRGSADKISSQDAEFHGSMEEVFDALKSVESVRGIRESEKYRIVTHTPRLIGYEIDFLEVESKFTRIIQRRPRTIKLTIEKNNEGITIRYTQHDRSLPIIDAILYFLAESAAGEGELVPLNVSAISFEDILDPKLRVKFFNDLIKRVEGLDFQTVTNVRIQRLPASLRQGAASDENSVVSEDVQEVEDRIKRVVFRGTDLTLTPEFKKFTDDGFFTCSVSWESVDSSEGSIVEMTAGFEVPDMGINFYYIIVGKRVIDKDGVAGERERVNPATTQNYYQRIAAAAKLVLSEIRGGGGGIMLESTTRLYWYKLGGLENRDNWVREIGNSLAAMPYAADENRGFVIDRATDDFIDGDYLWKTLSNDYFEDPLGNRIGLMREEFHKITFHISRKSAFLELLNPSRHVHGFLNLLSGAFRWPVSIERASLDIEKALQVVQGSFENFIVTEIVTAPFFATTSTLVDVSFRSLYDVKNDARTFLDCYQHTIRSVCGKPFPKLKSKVEIWSNGKVVLKHCLSEKLANSLREALIQALR